MQGNSKLVIKRACGAGDIVESGTGKVVGPFGKGVEVLVFRMEPKTWVIRDITNKANAKKVGEEKFVEGQTPALEWTDEKSGMLLRRDKTLNFYGILADDLAKGEGAIPVRLSFSRSNRIPAKLIADKFATYMQTKILPFNKLFKLTSETTTHEGNEWYVFNTVQTRETTQEEQALAFQWNNLISKSKVKIAEDMEDDEESVSGGTYQARPAQTINEETARF
jgi:hypothetical protein